MDARDLVTYDRHDRIANITLRRPEVLNALNDEADAQLISALQRFDTDEDAWVAIISGEGRCFSVGADVKQPHWSADAVHTRLGHAVDPYGLLGRTLNWKPVIAAVHGYCLGRGFGLALESDLLVASRDASFAISETRRGLPGGRIWARLQTLAPGRVGLEMAITGEPVTAETLYDTGAVSRLVDTGQHLDAARELADVILRQPPLSVRSTIRLHRWRWSQAVAQTELYLQPLQLHLSHDFAESVAAFRDSRTPVYNGH